MKKVIMKFGGTSVGTGENIRQVANIVTHYSKEYRITVVVSALAGVTNKLLEIACQAKKGDEKLVKTFTDELLQKHKETVTSAITSKVLQEKVNQIIEEIIVELGKVLTGICYVGELTAKSKDYVVSFGERLSAPIVWGTIQDHNLETQCFTGREAGIVTDSNFGEADPLMNFTIHLVRERLGPLLEKGVIPVVTGFIAANQDGVVTTVGRGGSDYTATILGVALSVNEVWIWTDVDGILTTDPKLVSTARLLPQLSYQEAAEMAIFGAKAMHPRALGPVSKENIPVRIRNTFQPENLGTLITKEPISNTEQAVKAVAMIKNVAMLNVNGATMVGAPGSYAKVFDTLGKNNINIMMIATAISEANISVIIKRSMLSRAISNIEIALSERGGLVSEVTAEDDVAVIAVVGAYMKGSLGLASKIFDIVAKKGINIRMIAQGSSESNISFVVKEKDGIEIVKAIHEEFNLDKT
ncbi:MAG: aspartate kinase [Candidatus Bathyarchaeota archaeon]|uniref:aspartate kinase n=1 Tax=Candidatus Bathycorpusculum sp. TaxID=2994959 RepID=UPI00283881F8|nr:aspartate kinase [Candidatus Termiticorpusculum sp.]MCL2257321.1 aspartate kinase [Candidatus Termiticorpusculum sp.]MCL2292190.1 aspartate kinase [Candidatus Termiticorpusculum sp.]